MTSSSNPSSRLTRAFVFCDILTGPLFFAVAITQAFLRPGYNIRLNSISQLSLGDLDGSRSLAFLLRGLLAVARAIRTRRLLKRQKGGT